MSPSVQSAPVKPADLVGRDSEWDLLAELWDTPKPELVIVRGRRHGGKSYVLGRFVHAVGGRYYQATRRTEAEPLARLSRAIGDRFADSALQRGVGFPDWEALFGYVTDRAGAGPFLLVLGEFPYLSDAARAVVGAGRRAAARRLHGRSVRVGVPRGRPWRRINTAVCADASGGVVGY